MQPVLLHSQDGKLYVQLTLGGCNVVRPTPEMIREYSEQDLKDFFLTIVPGMTKELIQLRKDKLRKINRRVRNAKKGKRQRQSKEQCIDQQAGDPATDVGGSPTPDGSQRV